MLKGQKPTPIEDFKKHLSSATDIDWARLAAFIDGEGTIYINRYRAGSIHKTQLHRLSVSIKNSSVLLMAWLTGTFGGSVSQDKGKNVLARLPIYQWRLNELQAEVVLAKCLPFFVIKREQAEIGIAFRSLKSSGRRGQAVSEDVLRQRDAFRDRIHLLNSPSLKKAINQE